MDSALRAALVIGLTIFLKNIMLSWWERYKERKASEPIPLKLKNGVYVPWGPVQRINRLINIAVIIWAVYMAILIVWLIAFKAGWVGGLRILP